MDGSGRKGVGPLDPRSWMEAAGKVAADATAWWLDPPSWTNLGDVWKMGDRLLAQLVEGVARRFTGERIEVSHDGRPVHLTLSSVHAHAPTASMHGADVAFELKDVAWEDHQLGVVDGVAHGARMRPGLPTAALIVDQLELRVTAPADALLTSLGPRPESGWSLGLLPNGRATLRHRRSRMLAAEVEPTVVDGGLRGDLRALRIGNRRIATPKWLKVARSLPPPELPAGARLLALAYRDGAVEIRLAVPGFSRDVDLKPLRRAITGVEIDLPIPV